MMNPTPRPIGAAQPQVMAPSMGPRPVAGLFNRPTAPQGAPPAAAPPNGGPADTSRGPLSPTDMAKIQGFEGLDRIYPRAAAQMQQQAPAEQPAAPPAQMRPNPAPGPFPPMQGRALPNSLSSLGAKAIYGDREV